VKLLLDTLVQPDNLRALVREVAPGIADHLDYPRAEVVGKPYFLDDWRSRERDVLVRLPYRDAAGQREILVCVLVEHQSDMDQAMPLRMLVYAVYFWELEWKSWTESHQRGEPLRLTPILPVVLYTGPKPWDTSRSLADLFDVPEPWQAWLPSLPMPLWDLQEHSAEELLGSEDPFLRVLAVAAPIARLWTSFLRPGSFSLSQGKSCSARRFNAEILADSLRGARLDFAMSRHLRFVAVRRVFHNGVTAPSRTMTQPCRLRCLRRKRRFLNDPPFARQF